jgi:hypothetical protein
MGHIPFYLHEADAVVVKPIRTHCSCKKDEKRI